MNKVIAICCIIVIGITSWTILSKSALNIISTEKNKPHYNALIFDLGNVLVTTHLIKLKMLVICHIIKNPKAISLLIKGLSHQLFMVLDTVPALSKTVAYRDNQPLPQIMVDWLLGIQSHEIILKNSLESLQKQTQLSLCEKAVLEKIINGMFIPEQFIQNQIMIQDMLELALSCKVSGYKLYILSNWDPESFKILQSKYAHFFNQCDGIMISGEEHLVKPDHDLYVRLCERFTIDPLHAVFIDDELKNVAAARTYGITSILHTSYKHTLQEFKKLGIIA